MTVYVSVEKCMAGYCMEASEELLESFMWSYGCMYIGWGYRGETFTGKPLGDARGLIEALSETGPGSVAALILDAARWLDGVAGVVAEGYGVERPSDVLRGYCRIDRSNCVEYTERSVYSRVLRQRLGVILFLDHSRRYYVYVETPGLPATVFINPHYETYHRVYRLGYIYRLGYRLATPYLELLEVARSVAREVSRE